MTQRTGESSNALHHLLVGKFQKTLSFMGRGFPVSTSMSPSVSLLMWTASVRPPQNQDYLFSNLHYVT